MLQKFCPRLSSWGRSKRIDAVLMTLSILRHNSIRYLLLNIGFTVEGGKKIQMHCNLSSNSVKKFPFLDMFIVINLPFFGFIRRNIIDELIDYKFILFFLPIFNSLFLSYLIYWATRFFFFYMSLSCSLLVLYLVHLCLLETLSWSEFDGMWVCSHIRNNFRPHCHLKKHTSM